MGQLKKPTLVLVMRHANYRSLHSGSSGLAWRHLCANDDGETVQTDEDADAQEECMEMFESAVELPTTLAEVEAIKNFRFDPSGKSTIPSDLFQREDDSTKNTFTTPVQALV
ncbi:unnamed protein product [Phytophthora fragariaefolia]|uniref:Unnamed protein product n=1 Tax=Phytophthora fragariaefolia TaxID=1490495 RepID=A0A9W7D4M1_9STRA|nr:unnamed protein product [Phytophthora fragariaefolia]